MVSTGGGSAPIDPPLRGLTTSECATHVPGRLDLYALTGASVPHVEDLRTAGVRAFIRLWNRNHPEDPIDPNLSGAHGKYTYWLDRFFDAAPAHGWGSRRRAWHSRRNR